MNIEKVARINELLGSNVGNRIITVTFRKKDSSLRTMLLKRDPELERTIKGTRPEATAKANQTLATNGMRRVQEMTPDGTAQFRTLNLDTVTQITVNGTVHTFAE